MKSNNLPPLNYAIIKCFLGGDELCSGDVIAKLEKDYLGYKLLNEKGVEEALMTSMGNGLLEEAKIDIDNVGRLRSFYRITEFGVDMVRRYLG